MQFWPKIQKVKQEDEASEVEEWSVVVPIAQTKVNAAEHLQAQDENKMVK